MQNRRYLPDRCEFKFAARVRTATVTHDVELIIIQRQSILFGPILIDRSYCIGVVSNKKFFVSRKISSYDLIFLFLRFYQYLRDYICFVFFNFVRKSFSCLLILLLLLCCWLGVLFLIWRFPVLSASVLESTSLRVL